MAKYLASGDTRFPTQGSTEIQERVKHFESDVSFNDLQEQINLWLLFISTPVILNRPSIRTINFYIINKEKKPNKDKPIFYSQVHYILIGDANDSTNL